MVLVLSYVISDYRKLMFTLATLIRSLVKCA